MIASRFRFALLLGLAMLIPVGCEKTTTATNTAQQPTTNPDGPQKLPEVKFKIGSVDFTVEVADIDSEHAIGMMSRPSNPADHAMLFVFDEEIDRAFWMKNTLIPLDLIYLDRGGKIVSIKQGMPKDLRSIPSGGPSKYVIEMNRGRAAQIGLKPGDVVVIPEAVREPAK